MKTLFFLAALLIFISCKETYNNSSDSKGTIYYFTDYDKMDKMNFISGSDIILMTQIFYNREKVENIDSLNGKNLYIKVKKSEILKKGAKINLPNNDIEILVTEWSGKDELNINYNIIGSLKISEHNEFENTSIIFDFKLRTGLNDYEKYNFSTNFQCIKLYKPVKGKTIFPDSVNQGFKSNELRSVHLDGIWVQFAEYFYDKNMGRWMEYFHLNNPKQWKIQAGIMVEPQVSEFRVDGGRIFIDEKDGKKSEFLINSYKNDTLIITNQSSLQKNQYVFYKKVN